MSEREAPKKQALIVGPDQGRSYDMGRMRAVFFADGDETANRYSISEWSLDPRTEGPGAHAHDDDHIFVLLTGTLTLIIEGDPKPVGPGTYALIPGGTEHNFENHGADEARFISINIPAGFERMMPSLVQWFAKSPLGDVACAESPLRSARARAGRRPRRRPRRPRARRAAPWRAPAGRGR